ncbi:hypothetical protein [Roseivivax lentus]|uniref:hypothetical protein n=1 Tax=Roseivivax lentus TaxID=633194 RepID=UPI00117B6960|nr:hypothetical protein [Roseivivax lentus]
MHKLICTLVFVFVSSFGSTAFSATSEQVLEIWSFVHVDASRLSNSQAASVIDVIHGSDGDAEKRTIAKTLIGKYQLSR